MSADQLSTAGAAQSVEELVAIGSLDAYGLLRDGTQLTVWADLRGYDGTGDVVRRAFRLRSPSGEEIAGRLPQGEFHGYSRHPVITPTKNGFVVSGEPAVLISPDGTIGHFRARPGRRIQEGDVLAAAAPGHVRLLRPGAATDHVLESDDDVLPLAVAGGLVYGYLEPPVSLGPPGPVRVGSWPGRGNWSPHVVGDLYDLEVTADGDHAAAWVCDEGGHGYGGGGRSCGSFGFAVTRDGGNSWHDLRPAERPFRQVDQAVAVNGQLFVKGWPNGFWRSTDTSWTAFARLRLPGRAVLQAEDGFVTAAVQRGRSLTVLRIGADGGTRTVVTLDRPPANESPGPGPMTASPVGSGDGSLILDLDGTISVLLTDQGARGSGSWKSPVGLAEGYLLVDRRDLTSATLLTGAGDRLPTEIGHPAGARAGDALLTTGRRVPFEAPPRYRHEHLWSFRPADRTFRELTPPRLHPGHELSGLVDDRGRAWLLQDRMLWRSDDGGSSWLSIRLPRPASTNLGSEEWRLQASGNVVLVVLSGPRRDLIRMLSAQGTWSTVALPPRMPRVTDAWLLRDGRLLLGPVAGQFWRGTSPTNRHFETIPAGPIAQVAPAGDLLYGVPLSPAFDDRMPLPLPADRKKVWLSRDSGTTWIEVTR